MSAIAYTVRRSERARHARLVVTPDGVELVVPRRMPLRQATSLVHDRRGWLERTLRRIATDQSANPPTMVRDGAALPYLGSELRLRVITQPGCSANSTYYTCAKNAYHTTKEHIGSGCLPTLDICKDGSDWLK